MSGERKTEEYCLSFNAKVFKKKIGDDVYKNLKVFFFPFTAKKKKFAMIAKEKNQI